MSSTRVKERRGKHLDFYRTPDWCVKIIHKRIISSNETLVLDPCAGDGALTKGLKGKITSIDVQPCFEPELLKISQSVIIGDFLGLEMEQTWDLIIANPPFSQAQQFVEKCLSLRKQDGVVCFLLRLPFLAGIKRYQLYQEHKPSKIVVLSKRPTFGGSNIDSCDYAWFVWNGSNTDCIIDWAMPDVKLKYE